jgi:hypothetical protein
MIVLYCTIHGSVPQTFGLFCLFCRVISSAVSCRLPAWLTGLEPRSRQVGFVANKIAMDTFLLIAPLTPAHFHSNCKCKVIHHPRLIPPDVHTYGGLSFVHRTYYRTNKNACIVLASVILFVIDKKAILCRPSIKVALQASSGCFKAFSRNANVVWLDRTIMCTQNCGGLGWTRKAMKDSQLYVHIQHIYIHKFLANN